MIKTYQILIDYKEQLLQEQKRKLTILEQKISTLENEKKQHYTEIENERNMLQEHPEFSSQFANFYNSVKEKIDSLNKTIDNIKTECVPIQKEIEILFSDIKKFETISEQKLRQELERMDKEETAQMDELTLIRFLKEQNSNG